MYVVNITLFPYVHEVTTAQCEIKYVSTIIAIIRYKSTELVAYVTVSRSLNLDTQTIHSETSVTIPMDRLLVNMAKENF
jgi:hypothetical protein